MATKFTSLVENKESKKTEFTHYLNTLLRVVEAEGEPKHIPLTWDNVLYLGRDSSYGDMFKCWNNNETDFVIYFGEKGDEY